MNLRNNKTRLQVIKIGPLRVLTHEPLKNEKKIFFTSENFQDFPYATIYVQLQKEVRKDVESIHE